MSKLIWLIAFIAAYEGLHLMDVSVASYGNRMTNGFITLEGIKAFHIGFYIAKIGLISLFARWFLK